jgi:hypothetical protein
MSNGIDIEQRQKEEARWRILRVLDAGRPIAVSEQIVWRVLNDIKIPFSLMAVRRELEYLCERDLITIEGEDSETWFGKLTRTGIDIVEYTIPCEPGIARPRKYW